MWAPLLRRHRGEGNRDRAGPGRRLSPPGSPRPPRPPRAAPRCPSERSPRRPLRAARGTPGLVVPLPARALYPPGDGTSTPAVPRAAPLAAPSAGSCSPPLAPLARRDPSGDYISQRALRRRRRINSSGRPPPGSQHAARRGALPLAGFEKSQRPARCEAPAALGQDGANVG